MTAVIETQELTKSYGSERGIEAVSLEVRPGEVFGFLGSNGAGKTTTIRVLLDLLHPTGGRALLFGLDSRRDSVAIRARLGNLPGDFAYDERLTGRELLEFFAALRGMRDLGQAPALAERFEANLDRPLGHLSRGNRQKIGLIQALFHGPELLILDEPTSGLDPLMQEQFLEVIGEQRDSGVTVFLSSHELREVQRVCDRVGIIRAGRLVDVEPVAQLRHRTMHRVELVFANPVGPEELAALPGVRDLTVTDGRMAFRVEGALDPVIKAAARHTVRDVEIVEPGLEEVFLGFYQHGEG
ncbi:MAG: ABC transporter ATP-binding protein [Thermoleophilia bacterium]